MGREEAAGTWAEAEIGGKREAGIRGMNEVVDGRRDRGTIDGDMMMIGEASIRIEMIVVEIGENMTDLKTEREREVLKGREIENGQKGDGEIRIGIGIEIGEKMRGAEGMSGIEIGTGIEKEIGVKREDVMETGGDAGPIWLTIFVFHGRDCSDCGPGLESRNACTVKSLKDIRYDAKQRYIQVLHNFRSGAASWQLHVTSTHTPRSTFSAVGV
jgi:hypothetical protein